MHTRQNALNKWLEEIFKDTPFTIAPLAGDASFRRYFRLHAGNTTRVVMDAPPDKETIEPFINIARLLAEKGIHAPSIHAVEYTQGFILLEDLGDDLFLKMLSSKNAEGLYTQAMNTLSLIQQCPTSDLPAFDTSFMLQELSLFQEWFLEAYLGLTLTTEDTLCLEKTFEWLTQEITNQPQVFIHRDYHSRNLIVTNKAEPYALGVIDFQDAMRGPFTYDLVSLLKDCYKQWPHAKIMHWLSYFYDQLPKNTAFSFADFTRAFDLCGLQRHLKVLGIFCRLHLRDHKASYLRDLPLTLHYVNTCLSRYEALQPLAQFMKEKIALPSTESVKA